MTNFLQETEIIDFSNTEIQKLAINLSSNCNTDVDIAKSCFLYVRDNINHSGDYKDNITTCKASDVLKYKTGWCYAKSHLLAALLRAIQIPAGLCYQRLTISDDKPPFCLHGLNAVYLEQYGWYRIDARGNKPGVLAVFTPPIEQLAYPIVIKGEADLPEIWAEPLAVVVQALENGRDYLEVSENLPDI